MKILDFFLFLWVIFALLDPDPKPWVDDDMDPMAFEFMSQTFLLAPDFPLLIAFLPGKWWCWPLDISKPGTNVPFIWIWFLDYSVAGIQYGISWERIPVLCQSISLINDTFSAKKRECKGNVVFALLILRDDWITRYVEPLIHCAVHRVNFTPLVHSYKPSTRSPPPFPASISWCTHWASLW